MIDFSEEARNFNDPKHSGLWGLAKLLVVYIPQVVALQTSLWSKEKLIFIIYFVYLLQ